MKKKKQQVNKKIVIFAVAIIVIIFAICFSTNITKSMNKGLLEQSNTSIVAEQTNRAAKATEPKEFVYLSDLDYITANNWSYNGWNGHSIQKDKNPDGATIRLKIDGANKIYVKGMGVHAKGQLTYDISALSKQYSRFTAAVGVDASKTAYSDLGITISVSNDGNTWQQLFQRNHIRAGAEGSKVDVDISNYTFLRIYVDPHGSNNSDHAVIANAKLVTADYNESEDPTSTYDKAHPLSYYDEILNAQTPEYNMEHNYRLILEREVVRKIGYEEIQAVATFYPEARETMDWIFNPNDNTVLEQCVAVGELRNGLTFFNLLSDLYNEYKDCLQTENGYVYQKMMISMAASYTTDTLLTPLQFGSYYANYDYIERFRLMKQLLDTNKFDRPAQFKGLPVELMRLVTNDGIRNDEYIWLNAHSATKGSNKFNCHSYQPYVHPPHYDRNEFFNLDNKAKYSNKYKLDEYGVPFGDGRTQRYWMVMEAGGICWNISRLGQSVARVNGIPSTGAYQPGHEPYFFYTTNSSGKGVWQINYNVGGWGVCSTTWGGSYRYRLPMDWANKYFTDQAVGGAKGGTSSGYIVLAQANLNDYENYTKSVWYNLLANSYTNNQDKLKAYSKSLEIQPLNLDSYDNLIKLYIAMGDEVTNAEWCALANKIIDNYTFFPPASYDLIKVVNPHISDLQDRLAMDQKLQDSLQRASNATDRDTLQRTAVVELAGALLGKTKVDLATFSFDGANAGKIMIDKAYADYDFLLSYSLDGGNTYSEQTMNHAIQLSEEEILSITGNNDIKLKMSGTEAVYTIDIIDNPWPKAVYGNDLENRIVDANLDMEWRLKNEDGTWPERWTSYEEQSPDLTGNKVVQVRMRSMGNKKFSNTNEFTFTQDETNLAKRYIPVSHLSVKEAGSQINPAANAISGNYNNYWRSGSSSGQKYLVISFSKPIYLSAVEFIPGPTNGNDGRFTSATIYNGSNSWQSYKPWGNLSYATSDNNINDAIRDKQVFDVRSTFTDKLSSVRITFSSASTSVNVREINFYQDMTKEPHPTAGIGYSTDQPTNGNVVARLVNKSSDSVRITNNGGSDSYTFTENGSFTFEFIDDDTQKTGSATATVNWIDREAPTATIEYDVTTTTNGSVFATLKPSEDVTVTSIDKYRENADGKVIDISGNVLEDLTIDEDGYVKDTYGNTLGNVSPFKHIFRQNGSYTFEFVDKAGNPGEATAKVDWIDQSVPEATVYYDITQKTNQNVTARLEFNKDDVTVTNNEGKPSYTFTKNGEFTFTFVDTAGNTGSKAVAVSWIDKDPPTAIPEYSTTKKTNQPVTVTLTKPSEEYTITNNGGSDTYTFTKNGTFIFKLQDKAGNQADIETAVDWIDTVAPTAKVQYSTTKKTNQNVVATLVEPSEKIKVVNNDGKMEYTFKENGSFTFTIEDEAGNQAQIAAAVTWIDKNIPTASIQYSTTTETENPVTATLVNPSKEVKVVNNNGKKTYTFTKNGSFTFIIEDNAGNRAEIVATVNWITREEEPDDTLTSMVYQVTDQKVSQIPAGTTSEQFKKNISTKQEVILQDRNGKTVPNTTKIGTGMKAVVGKTAYTLVVPGDIDGNGELTITDLAKLCLHYIEDEMLEGPYKEAADLDNNNKITVTDLAKLQLTLIETK